MQRQRGYACLLPLLLVHACICAEGSILWVSEVGVDDPSCGASEGAASCKTIQYAIDAASSGDVIRVGAGRYTGAGNHDLQFRQKHLIVESAAGPEETFLDGSAAHRAFLLRNETGEISGFTMLNGSASLSPDDPYFYKGALIYVRDGNVTLRNCVFTGIRGNANNNEHRGVVAVTGSGIAHFYGCLFTRLTHRAVVFLDEHAVASFSDCVWRQNEGTQIFTEDFDPQVTLYRPLMEDNTHSAGTCFYNWRAAKLYVYSGIFRRNFALGYGAVLFSLEETVQEFYDTRFEHNSVVIEGAVLYTSNSGRTFQCKVVRCDFIGNSAASGPVVNFLTSPVIIINSTMRDNTARDTGIMRLGGTVTLQNLDVIGNHAAEGAIATFAPGAKGSLSGSRLFNNTSKRGGLVLGGSHHTSPAIRLKLEDNYFSGNEASESGGAIVARLDARVTITGTHFEGNRASSGGAVAVEEGADLTFESCLFSRNEAARDGGAVLLEGKSQGHFADVEFRGNRAGSRGGAIHLADKALMQTMRVRFEANHAYNGAAVFLSSGLEWTPQQCNASLQQVAFVDNRADSSGAALYWEMAEPMCPTVCNVRAGSATEGAVTPGCPCCFSGNQALGGYGNNSALESSRLSVSGSSVLRVTPGGSFSLSVSVLDHFNRTRTLSTSRCEALYLSLAPGPADRPNVTLLGADFVPVLSGTASFDGVTAFAPPGTYLLSLVASGSAALQDYITLTVMPCPSGYALSRGPQGHGCEFVISDFEASRALRYSAFALACVGILLTLWTSSYVITHRDHRVIKAASVNFCLIILSGLLCAYAHVLTLQYPVDRAACLLQPWVGHAAIVLVFGALFAKTRRVARIFGLKSLQVVRMSDSAIVGQLGVLALLVCAYLVVWMLVAPPEPHSLVYGAQRWSTCGAPDAPFSFSLVIFILEGAFLAYGVYLAWITRGYPTLFNEAKYIGIVLYTTFLAGVLVVPLLLTVLADTNPDVQFVFHAFGVLVSSSVALVALFLPKYLAIRQSRGDDDDGVTRHTGGLSTIELTRESVLGPSGTAHEHTLAEAQERLLHLQALVDTLRKQNAALKLEKAALSAK